MEIPDRVSFVSGQNSDDRVRTCELTWRIFSAEPALKLSYCCATPSMQRSWHLSGLCLPRLMTAYQPISRRTTKKRKFLKLVIFNGRIAERQDKLCFIVEESRLVWPSCCGLCWAVFWGTLGCVIVVGGRIFSEFRELVWINVGGRSYVVFLEQLVLIQEFARRSLIWRNDRSFQAFYCSLGARAECLQIVFVVIGGRLRGTIQRSSSLTSSSSSRVVYEWVFVGKLQRWGQGHTEICSPSWAFQWS